MTTQRDADPSDASAPNPPAEGTEAAASSGEPAFDAMATPIAAALKLFSAFVKLVVAEGRVLVAALPFALISVIALIAVSVSLWVCMVALVGWLLMQATQSLGIALGLLVVIHIALVAGVWASIKYALRQATFPHARGEVLGLIGSLCQELDRAKRGAAERDPGGDA
jgi:hypothetical protein